MPDILVGLIMGSQSDWETMKNTAAVLDEFGVKYDTPEAVAEAQKRGWLRGRLPKC